MNKNKRVLVVALAVVLGSTGTAAQAAVLQAGDILTIDAGVLSYDSNGDYLGVSSGSWFAISDGQILGSEQVAIMPGSDGGLTTGSPQAPGAIDGWTINGIAGHHYTVIAPTGGTTAGIDFSGWVLFYNGDTVVPAGSVYDWTPPNCDTLGCSGVSFDASVAAFSWSGVYGDSYSLWYAMAFYPDPSWFSPLGYLLHLEGSVLAAPSAVPLPAAAWLFGSGLLGLMGFARPGDR